MYFIKFSVSLESHFNAIIALYDDDQSVFYLNQLFNLLNASKRFLYIFPFHYDPIFLCVFKLL